MTLYIHGMGHFHPEPVITNKFLEELDIGTNDEWIVERVGIRERHSALPLEYLRATKNRDVREAESALLYTNADLAQRAGEMALARAGVDRSQIGLVISGSSAPRILCPAEANFIAKQLGIEALAYDVNSACSTFLTQLYNLSLMDPAKMPEFVLITQTEQLTSSMDYTDRGAAVLFGDGAAAAVISCRADASGPALGASAEHTWPDSLDVMGWEVADDGLKVVFSRDIPALVQDDFRPIAMKFLAGQGLTPANVGGFVCHPGGAKVIDALEACFELSEGALTHTRDVLRDHGNMSAATVLFVLKAILDDGAKGPLLLTTLGPGFTAGLMLVHA